MKKKQKLPSKAIKVSTRIRAGALNAYLKLKGTTQGEIKG